MTTSVQRRYPIRYWTTLIFFTGIPNFVHFDPTGLTHKYGLFNLSSFTDIGFTLIAVTMLVTLTALSREGILTRKLYFDRWIWIVLLLVLVLATILQPASKFVAAKATDIPLSLYRLGQWVLGAVLLLSLYSRARPDEAPGMLTQLTARICWATLAMIWIMVPLAPSLAYTSEDGTPGSLARLGGIAIHPSMVALAASITFLHSMLFLRNWKRVVACLISVFSLALTYTRAQQIVFAATLLLFTLFFARTKSVRWLGIAAILLGVVGTLAMHSRVEQYLARGQSQRDVNSFGGRAATWEAGMRAFYERPLIGYGFIAGPKNAMRDVWHEAHWIPPHAHNDFIQALMSGGIVVGALVSWLYVSTFWKGWRRARVSGDALFFLLIFFMLLVTAVESTNLTTGFGKPALFFVMAYLVLVAEGRRLADLASLVALRRHLAARAAPQELPVRVHA